ncbi:hypothetical protein CDN93_00725 [Escherichia coli]|uniref:Uncharacterized protein n=1 Tax=Salmonella typhi TaxID=90370 RepID=A0A5X9G4F1_SALTI|nr:hypothetical protein AM408_00390 [Escherichia coli]EAB8876001.1 hypothetical protein [Salmonella enterica subsp. enterica serovar Typhi]EAN8348642.1 hypothetical protein [Salmonella enterica]TFB46939.1 hypothetical protein E3T85_02490 [Shigella sonnei]AUV23998.1 hypothetical protein C2U45_25295 [Escherichia coli]
MQRGKPPEWWEKQKGSRGIRRGQWYRLVFQFPIREREGVDRCIGVICSSVSYELFPNVHENGGIGYQFLYEGDELKCYEHGLLIESVE